jgi:hypothetical protein
MADHHFHDPKKHAHEISQSCQNTLAAIDALSASWNSPKDLWSDRPLTTMSDTLTRINHTLGQNHGLICRQLRLSPNASMRLLYMNDLVDESLI